MRLLEPRLSRVGFLSARIALISTAIVALVYLVIAAGVVLIVQRNLTTRIDSLLQQSLVLIASGPQMPAGGFRPPAGGPPGGDQFGPPLIVWTVLKDGSVTSGDTSASLPLQDRHVQGPETITVAGSLVRVEGRTLGDDYVIAGMSMSGVQDATRQFVLAEAIVAPILLLAVFFGALTIGRRVGAPIELARQRQMEFTADASHELRTPLSVIEATTTLALSRDRDAAWYRTAFVRVNAESLRIRRLVEDLLWLARFDATRGQADAEPVDVTVLAQQAVDRFTSLAEARALSLSLDSGLEPAVVTASPEWLDRLIGVLLDNACKYSSPGGTVEVVVRTEGNRVRLEVDDSGPGIPPEERSRIFDRFHRATQQSGGAGLGLAIADAVVRVTNGRWEIRSSAVGGASMSVTWPRTLAGARMSARTEGGAAMPRPATNRR
jgi:signal transduction histidine kinase